MLFDNSYRVLATRKARLSLRVQGFLKWSSHVDMSAPVANLSYLVSSPAKVSTTDHITA
jgi:hypothetical protein